MSLPLDLPLRGSQLIEASAGTGKTFTIALLYVRLVLGHGQPDNTETARDNGYLRQLMPSEILVVTFTEAASLELRDRIRARLVEAAEAFRVDKEDADAMGRADPLLQALRDEYASTIWPACARRLQIAAEWMDDAAVSTIHSWAQKMLKEHAFDSGKLFQQELVSDLTDQTLEAVTDYWRTRVYPLNEALAAIMVDLFGSPNGLYKALRNALQRHDAELVFRGEAIDPGALADTLEQASQMGSKPQHAEAEARESYAAQRAAIRQALHELRPVMNGSTFKGANDDATFASWLDELDRWGQGELPLDTADFVQKLSRKRLRLNKKTPQPDFAFHDHLQTWQGSCQAHKGLTDQLKPLVLADARTWVTERLTQQLRDRAQLGFDDMIRGLDDALAGPSGAALARRIRDQFPVAMIDEFQDTDPSQYRIFDQVYRIEDNAQDTGLILIGDPKQAIYGFRGGDIYTYLRARRATAGRLHSLDTNFRSSEAMVTAVNHLFHHAEQHERAAFRFGARDDTPVPFHSVKAQGRKDQLILEGSVAPAMVGWLVEGDDVLSQGTYLREAAAHCANRIAGWLTQSQQGKAGFRQPDGEALTPLKASDIAILVRDRNEAAAIRRALSERNLPSVYLSDRDSVFASGEAKDLLRWLQAMAAPDNGARLRAALATSTLALPLSRLDELQQDELAWEKEQERFIAYRQRWHRHGVLPALRQLLHDFDVPRRLLDREHGERRLTNLLHLTEWAQQASDTLDGDHALTRVLAEHIASPGGEEQILRLESDAELIQVVTIFKSKGLEYPIVALPFVCTTKEITGNHGTPLYHRDDTPLLELATKKEQAKEGYALANDERLSEEMRLLYVAFTRARHATFLGLAPLKVGNGKTSTLHKTALGYLLDGGKQVATLEDLTRLWEDHCEACSHLHIEPVPNDSERLRYEPIKEAVVWKQPRYPTHPAFNHWWIASYSALQQKGTYTPETVQSEILVEESDTQTPPVASISMQRPLAGTLHAFPRGPGPGTFLHGLLESLAEDGFDRIAQDDRLDTLLAWRCRQQGWEDHIPVLRDGLKRLLSSPLAPHGDTGPVLDALTHYQAEPEFWFATHNAQTYALDELVKQHILPGQPRPALGYHQLNGLMKGFIDLLAEYQGRYYVIDWKSNWLGPNDEAYQAEAMDRAMLDKRYDVQLAVYLLALHRHLRQTLPNYHYDRHVGGAMLVFLRGIGAESRGVQHVKPPLSFINALDDLMAGATYTKRPSDDIADARSISVLD